MEQWIDAMDEQLPPLTTFILPSGGLGSAHLHLARSTCRRAERSVVPLVARGDCEKDVGIYMNRLSDFLFQAARTTAMKAGKPETTYKPCGSNEK
jgi:ATP:cob(I)alamin adenosyltransferase